MRYLVILLLLLSCSKKAVVTFDIVDYEPQRTVEPKPEPAKPVVFVSDTKPSIEFYPPTIYFGFDSFELLVVEAMKLDYVTNTLMKYNNKNITITGHTCPIGTEKYNNSLGFSRSEAVKDYLISRGIISSRIETRSKGEIETLDTKQLELNRRAEIQLTD